MKNNKISSLIMILGVLTAISICSVIIVVTLAKFPQLGLSSEEASHVGGVVGGVTAPIVGMFSAYLLYEALTAQRLGNESQRIKNDSDIIFILIDQLDKDYISFSTKDRISGADKTMRGFEALQYFSEKFMDKRKDKASLIASNEMTEIWYLLESYQIIRERVLKLSFSSNSLNMFNKKLELYYQTKFQNPVNTIVHETIKIKTEMFDRIRDIHSENYKNL